MRSLLALSLAASALLLTACHSNGGYLNSDPELVYGPGVVEFPAAERVYLPTYRRAVAAATIGVRAAGEQTARINFLARIPPAAECLPRIWSQRDQACRPGFGDCAPAVPVCAPPPPVCVPAPPPPVERQVFRAPPVKRGGNCGKPHRHNSSCHPGGGHRGPAFTRSPGPPLPPPIARPPRAAPPRPVVPPPPAAPDCKRRAPAPEHAHPQAPRVPGRHKRGQSGAAD